MKRRSLGNRDRRMAPIPDPIYDTMMDIMDCKLQVVKLTNRTNVQKQAYKKVYNKRHVLKTVLNPITEKEERRLVCRKTGTLILRTSEVGPMIKLLVEKTGIMRADILSSEISKTVSGLGTKVIREVMRSLSRENLIEIYTEEEPSRTDRLEHK